MGWHLRRIDKGILGNASKILEECEEFLDAEDQKLPILVLWELSDVIGAIEAYLKKFHPSIKIEDLIAHAKKNSEMFRTGVRE